MSELLDKAGHARYTMYCASSDICVVRGDATDRSLVEFLVRSFGRPSLALLDPVYGRPVSISYLRWLVEDVADTVIYMCDDLNVARAITCLDTYFRHTLVGTVPITSLPTSGHLIHHTIIAVFQRKPVFYGETYGDRSSVISGFRLSGSGSYLAKASHVYATLLRRYTRESEVCLDLFCGGMGLFAAECARLRRRYCGVEIDAAKVRRLLSGLVARNLIPINYKTQELEVDGGVCRAREGV